MSSFGTGSALTSSASINLTPYSGTDGNNAGTDGLVPGPAALQDGYILGAGGDWTLNVKEVNDGNGQIDVNESSNRIATTKFVQTLIGNAQLGGGNANLSALGDTQFANLGADQFLQYNGNKWVNVDFTLDTISNVNLVGLAVGNTIVWDGAEWVPGVGGGGGGAANLDDLGDVDIGVVANKHFLVYDGAGQFVNRLITTADLDGGDKVVLMNADATFEAHNYNFTGATSITVPAPTADTHASTKKYVDDEITGLNLANTYQAKDASLDTITGIGNKDLLLGDGADSFEKVKVSAGVETFLRGAGSIDNLTDVDTSTQAPQNGQVLKWDGNKFVPQDDVDTNTQLSSNEVKDIVGDMLDGTETGISVSYDGANRNLDFVVSLAGFSVGALSDVDTSTQAPQNGQVLKWNGANFVPSADTGKTTEEIQGIVGAMVAGNTETGITVTYNENDGAGEGNGKLDFAVSLGGFSIRDLSDVANDALVNGKILKVVDGVLTQADETDTNTQLTDNQVKDIVGTMVAGNTETGISVTYDEVARNLDFEVASISSSDLTDVTLQAGAIGDVLRVSGVDGQNVPTAFVNTKLASSDLSDGSNVVLETANATFGANTYNFTGATSITVPAPTADTHASTKKYVDDGLATKQPLEATLTGLADIAPVDNDIIIATGDNTFGVINTSAGVQTFLASSAELGDLDKVNIAGNIGVANDGETLRWDGANLEWKNSKIAFGDLADVASTQNVALLNGNQTFTGTIVFTNDITATTQGKYISANTPTQDSHVATKKYVDDEMEAAGLVSSLTTLTDVTLGADNGNGVAESVGQVLKVASIANGDATYRNAQLAYTELSGTPVVGADIQAYNVALDSLATMGTVANKIIYSTAEDTFAESDITDYTRLLLAEANEGAVKSYLNLEIGTDVQAQNATLQGIANVGGVAAGKIIYTNGGADTFATSDISAFALTILEDATDADVRTTLGLGTASTKNTDFFLEATDGINALADVLIDNVANAQILIYDSDGGNNNNQWKNLTLSGDASLSNDGTLTIGASAITNAKMDTPFVNLTDGANTDKLNLGETITFAGTASEIEVSTTNDVAGNNAGATITIGLPNDVTIGNNLTVTGNLTVNGTTTTVDTTNMVIEDRVISLNSGEAGANANDIGLFFNRGTSDPALFIWDESVDKFKVGTQNGATASQAGEYALTLKKMEVETPAEGSDTTEVATTAWVRTHTSGLASSLDDLTDVNLGVKNPGEGNQDGVALANAQILVYDSDGGNEDDKWKNVSLSGDVAISNTGVASISSGVIVNDDINAGAGIAVSKLASSSVTVGTTEITLGTTSTTLSGMTGIDFTAGNASIASSLGAHTLTLGGAASIVNIAGNITLNNAPTNGSHATTKTYVDTAVATKQPLDASLTALALVETAGDKLIYATDVDTFATTDFTAKARELLDDATFADMRTTLGLAIGTNVQAQNVTLQGIADIGGVATGKTIYTKTVGDNVVWDVATFTDYAKGLLGNGSEATVKSYLNLEIGTDVQAYNARLADISALAPTADNFIVGNANNFVLKTPANAVASLGMGVAQHDLLIGDANANTFTTIATTASVRSFLASGSVGTLSDVSLVAGAVGDVLRVSSVDGNNVPNGFTSATLSYNDLSNTPTLGTSASKDAGTGADEVLLLTVANTLPALDGTNLTGLLKTSNNLQEIEDAGAAAQGQARDNIGLGNVATLDTTETGGAGDNGKAVITDAEGKLGAIDGSNLTALGSIGLHSNVDLTELVHGQGLVYSTTNGVNRFEPGTVPTVGTNVDQTPSITAQSISLNPNALVGGDLVIYGRVMEVIDYGSVADAFDADTDFELDFGAVTDTVIYCDEDYGVLVV